MDCSLFYQCVDGTRYGVSCRSEFAFDKDLKRCVYWRQAQCNFSPPQGNFTTVAPSPPTEMPWEPTTLED